MAMIPQPCSILGSPCCCPSVGNRYYDLRQAYFFDDIFEDFDDGALCALCLRSERNSEALPVPVLPSSVREYSLLAKREAAAIASVCRCTTVCHIISSPGSVVH